MHGHCQKKLCQCDIWWAGDDCNKSQFLNFEGKYAGVDDCQTDSVQIVITIDKTLPNRAWLDNFELFIEFTDQVRFEIPDQDYRGTQVNGEGQMLINAISFKYAVVNSGNSAACHVLAHRK